MIKREKTLAIIPARGGSKRLPRKNILPLAGKPLIGWTIEAAIKSNAFDRIIVSTDDMEIADTAIRLGASIPFTRPSELASDTSTSIDCVKHAVLWHKEKGLEFKNVALLQPTSPLRNSQDITSAMELFQSKNAASVLSVCEVDHPLKWCNTLDESLSLRGFIDDDSTKKRSQDFDSEYRLNGAIYIWNIKALLAQGSPILEPSFASIMPKEHSIDIDDAFDFKIAESLFSI